MENSLNQKRLSPRRAMSHLYLLSMTLTVFSIALYHVIQKLTPAAAHPLAALTVTFATAALSCFLLVFLSSSPDDRWFAFRSLNWASFALAFAILGTDLGFLLAYRAGWKLSVAPIIFNLSGTLLLIPIGVVLFKEHLSPINLIGVGVCLVGFVMINLK